MPHLRFAGLVALLVAVPAPAADPPRKTENVLVVTLDGFRWQEFFEGADESFIDSKQGVRDLPGLKERYWRGNPKGRPGNHPPVPSGAGPEKGQGFASPAKKDPARITHRRQYC